MIEEQEESLKESVDFTTDRMINTLFKVNFYFINRMN